MKKNKFLKDFSYSFLANIVSLLISTILILLVPRYIGVREYGYWQLYVFYTTYVSYMSFGISDGFYLRYGGTKYDDLNKEHLNFQFWFMVLYNIIFDTAIVLMFIFSSSDLNKNIIVFFTCIVGVMVVPKSLVAFSLQSSSRIKEYSIMVIIEKLLYFILVVILLVFNVTEFKYLIVADIVGKGISVIYGLYICKDFIFLKIKITKENFKELFNNFTVGIQLLIANLSSMLIIGIVRLFIEKRWDIETFGKVSLTLSLSNMVMLFINAVSVVLFPMLRNIDKEKLKDIYYVLRTVIVVPLLGILLFYYPGKFILLKLLPQYGDSMVYMSLLFPMIVFECKSMMLIVTYLKTLRKERVMLIVNCLTALLSLILSMIIANYKNITMMILLILVLLVFRCVVLEIYLGRLLNIKVFFDLITMSVLSIIFIVISQKFNDLTSFCIYLLCYLAYVFLHKNNIISAWKYFKKIT